jgi:high-affinity iron transporter
VRTRTGTSRSRLTAAVALVAAAAALFLLPTAARAEAPWQQGEQIRNGLFDAQSDILLSGGAQAAADVRAAQGAVSGKLERQMRASSPRSLADLRAALADAESAAASGDDVGLAAARGRALAALRHGAFDVAEAAAAAGETERARGWLLIRDFRQATRFTRPGVDATAALDAFEAGEGTPQDVVTGIRKDLLDAYQARLVNYVSEATEAQERGFDAARAENAALAAGYWSIIADEYEEQRNPAARAKADSEFAAMAAAAERSDGQEFIRWRDAALNDLSGFTAAPFTAEEQARRATQLTRFLDLVPIEYDHGTDDGRVTIAFEIQESIAFMEGARSAFNDLQSELQERDPEGVQAILAAFDRLDEINADANEGREVASLDEVEDLHDEASDALEGMLPEEWEQSDTDADFDLIEISLDQMEAAVNAGEREQAEQARLSAYAFFEFGPERFLNSLDPNLVATVEGYVWYGAEGHEGLAELIASDGSGREIRETRLALDEELERAKQVTGEGAEGFTVITNAALIVFREGLEAILIIAAITASMVGTNRRLRKPILRGALLALPASAVLFVISVLVLDQLSQYGEKLEAIVGLVAIGVLLLVLNWFFHKVYWTEWIAGHRKRGKALAGAAGTGVATAGATVAGLYVLGFTSVFREGFETVLFLQALQLESGIGIVLAGVSLGLVFTAAVGALTFALERKLPYKKMLIVTGVLISLVLVVLVGNTMRTLQGVGWVSITPVDIDIPLWMGTWLGVFPTVETLGAQVGAFAFVIGSYFLAEFVRTRNVRRAVRRAEVEKAKPEARPQPVAVNGNGNRSGNGNGRRERLQPGPPPRRLDPEPEKTRERG